MMKVINEAEQFDVKKIRSCTRDMRDIEQALGEVWHGERESRSIVGGLPKPALIKQEVQLLKNSLAWAYMRLAVSLLEYVGDGDAVVGALKTAAQYDADEVIAVIDEVRTMRDG